MKNLTIFEKILKTCFLSLSVCVVLSGCSKEKTSVITGEPNVYPTAAAVFCMFDFVGGHEYTNAGVLFDTDSNYLEYGRCEAVSASGPTQTEFYLRGLKSNTTYYYRSYVSEKDKNIRYGETASFTTTSPISVTVTNISADEIPVTATVSAGKPKNYSVSEIGIQYALASSSIEKGQKIAANKSNEVSLTGLLANTEYIYRAYAEVYYNGLGTDYFYGKTDSFKTKDMPQFILTGSGNYPWAKYSGLGSNCLRSSNNGIHSTSSSSTLTINITKTSTLSFKYKVSSESKYDLLTIKLDNTTVANGISGTTSSSKTATLNPGAHTITLNYSKDNSQSSGDDRGYIYDIALDGSYISNSNIVVQ